MKKQFAFILLSTLLFPLSGQTQERWEKIVAEAKKEAKVVIAGPRRCPDFVKASPKDFARHSESAWNTWVFHP